MAFVIPDYHKRDLRSALEAAGWDVKLADTPADAWWLNELWRVRSRFRPVGVEAYVAFVGGPDGSGEPHPGASHVTIGPIPVSWLNAEGIPSFQLSKSWPQERARLIELLSQMRNAATSE